MTSEMRERYFDTDHGFKVNALSVSDYRDNKPKAIPASELEEDTIYEARGLSERLKRADSSISFNVMLSKLSSVGPNLASRGFLLVTLDDDYRPVSSHKSTIHSNRMIENAPIKIKRQPKLMFGATVTELYLLGDTPLTLDGILDVSSTVDSDSPLIAA
ncbi:MAG: hypothetical protein WAR37_04545 [Candidatus Microsaccharimonas sp.]